MPQPRPFTVQYIFQDQWGVGGRNLLILLAIYFGGLGGGMYLVSASSGYIHGALSGLLVAAIGKGLSHVFFLGRPERFWRAVARPGSSWISRGFLILVVFVITGSAYVLPSYPAFQWLPWASEGWFGEVLLWLSTLAAVLLIAYTGFLMNRSAIPFWNNFLLPIVFAVASLYSGAALSDLLQGFIPQAGANEDLIRQFEIWGGVAVLALLLLYFWGSYYSFNLASQQAVRSLALNRAGAWFFYGLFLVVGLSFPIVVFIMYTYTFAGTGEALLIMTAQVVEVLIGGTLIRYIFFRSGVFMPVY